MGDSAGLNGNGQGGSSPIDADRVVLVVAGAHLRAELEDRPVAAFVRDQVERRLREEEPELDGYRVLMCTDVWRLNDPALADAPTVSVGGPGVNAMTAALADRLPSAFVVDDRLIVQMDLEDAEPLAACWGADAESTRAAAEVFCKNYLKEFVRRTIWRLV